MANIKGDIHVDVVEVQWVRSCVDVNDTRNMVVLLLLTGTS